MLFGLRYSPKVFCTYSSGVKDLLDIMHESEFSGKSIIYVNDAIGFAISGPLELLQAEGLKTPSTVFFTTAKMTQYMGLLLGVSARPERVPPDAGFGPEPAQKGLSDAYLFNSHVDTLPTIEVRCYKKPHMLEFLCATVPPRYRGFPAYRCTYDILKTALGRLWHCIQLRRVPKFNAWRMCYCMSQAQ